jgi:fused signal recognition particle receptor
MVRKLAFVGVVLALMVTLADAYLQITGATLACPDWPGCYSHWIIGDAASIRAQAALISPGLDVDINKVWVVVGSRYLEALWLVAILVLSLLSWRQPRIRVAGLIVTWLLLMLAGAQGFLQIWLIKLNGMPLLQATHLWLGMMLSWPLYWLYLQANPSFVALPEKSGPLALNRLTMLLLCLQMGLGAWVSANQAGLSCKGFPTCNGQWWPIADYQNALNFFYGLFAGYSGVMSFDAQVAVNWLHRLGGLIASAFALMLVVQVVSARYPKPVRRAGLLLGLLLLLQVCLSLAGTQLNMPLTLVLAHHGMAVLLMLPLIHIDVFSRYGYAEFSQSDIQGALGLEAAEAVNESAPADTREKGLYVELPQASLLARLKLQLKRTRSGLGGILASLPIGEKAIDADLLEEIEASLIMADVGIDTTNGIINRLTQQLERHQLKDGLTLSTALKSELLTILAPCSQALAIPKQTKPFVILVVGVNGVGKTTTIGKLAKRLQARGHSVMLAAGDTFRAAAVEQLQVWGERNNIAVVAQHTGADSASVIYDGVQSAQAKGVDVLIADTAGRLHTKSNLMDELKKVKRIIAKLDETAPHEVLLVLDAGTGQNALSQTKQFNEAVTLTGLVLTKLDGTAKGGVIFALAKQTGIPIRFIGIGEGIDDLQDFDAENFVDALFVKD